MMTTNPSVSTKTTGTICLLLDNLQNQQKQAESIVTAVSIAKHMRTRLQGMMLEDEVLLRAAELPMVNEISLWSAEERPISSGSVQQTFRSCARRIKKELEKAANLEHIAWSFETIRDEKYRWIQKTGSSSDLLFIANSGNAQQQTSYHNLRFQNLLHHHKSPQGKTSMQVVFANTNASLRAVKTAVKIAKQTQQPLQILLMQQDSGKETEAMQRLHALLDSKAVRRTAETSKITNLSIKPVDHKQFWQAISTPDSRLFILPNDIKWLAELAKLRRILRTSHCPIIFVR